MRPLQSGVTIHERERASPGYTLFSPLFGTETLLVNMHGEIAHRWQLPGTPAGYSRLLPNGNLFCLAKLEGSGPTFKGGAQGGHMREVDWHGKIVHEYCDGMQHHDAHKLSNGNILYAGWEAMPPEHAKRVRGGRDMPHPPEGLYSDYVREVSPDGKTVWEWHAYDMAIEKYPLNPLLAPRVFGWCNTVFPLESGDVLISMRHINLIAIIDRTTKQFKWEMCDMSFGGQHDPQLLANGNILLFANGLHTYEMHAHSRILEIDPQSKEIVWSYQANPRTHFFSGHISGQERLANGNTLICEGAFGRLFEVTPAKEIVWEYISPYYFTGLDGDSVNWIFRAFRYAPDSAEIAGRLG